MNRGKKRKYDTMLESSTKDDKGEISKNDLFCDLCKIEVSNESSMKQHILGQKHKKLESAGEERRRVQHKCGIFARGYPPHLSQDVILNYFSKYGTIVWVRFGHAFVLLDYSEPSAVQNLMKKNHYLGGKHVMIKHRILKKEVSIDKPKFEEPTDYIEKTKDIPKFDDQIKVHLQHLQPHVQEQYPKYRKICSDLYEILSYNFPHCEIHPFGSTITGLNFKNSDIDVYVSGIRLDDNDKPYLYRTKSILSNSRRFANIIVIARAKIPILKCIHVETGISCDLNLRNKLGVCNSQLINYYLSIDPKVKDLMMFLKYWAKVHKISGQGFLFSNYTLCMMLIFFLQQDPYDFPSVLLLQQEPQTFRFHDGWNGGFQQIPVNATCLRYTPLLELLKNFFSFYADFEYGINVICPYLGKTVKKEQFENPGTLPDCFNAYKMYLEIGKPFKVHTTVCVQDPFEHCRNTTPIGSAADLERFVHFCRLSKKLCVDGENALLYNLLTMSPPNPKHELTIKPEFSCFSVPMRPNLRYIAEKIDDAVNRQEAIREAWFRNFVEFTMIVLKDFLKFDVTEMHDSTNAKNNKCEGQSDVYNNKNPVSYQCLGKINLWQSRKVTAKINNSGMDEKNQGIIKKEIAITDHLCDLYKDIPQSMPIINIEITLQNNVAVPEAVVSIKKITAYKNTFKSFAVFLSANLRSWYEIYEEELNLFKK